MLLCDYNRIMAELDEFLRNNKDNPHLSKLKESLYKF